MHRPINDYTTHKQHIHTPNTQHKHINTYINFYLLAVIVVINFIFIYTYIHIHIHIYTYIYTCIRILIYASRRNDKI